MVVYNLDVVLMDFYIIIFGYFFWLRDVGANRSISRICYKDVLQGGFRDLRGPLAPRGDALFKIEDHLPPEDLEKLSNEIVFGFDKAFLQTPDPF